MGGRIVVPFSGQQDAVDLAVCCAETHPGSEVLLLFVRNIGIRASFEPPTETARALADRYPCIRRLIVTDAQPFQACALVSLPPDLSRRLGTRSTCTACQASLLLVARRVSRELDAALAFVTRESLGPDIDKALRAILSGVTHVEVWPLRPSALSVPLVATQRCALASHRSVEPLDAADQARLEQWAAELAEQVAPVGGTGLAASVPLEVVPLSRDGEHQNVA